MDRRTALRLLSAGAALTVGTDLEAWGRGLHRGLGRGAPLRVLDPRQNATVVALCDAILPATDTPGAVAAQVNEFIDLLLSDWYDAADRDRFLAGLGVSLICGPGAPVCAIAVVLAGSAVGGVAGSMAAGSLDDEFEEFSKWEAF